MLLGTADFSHLPTLRLLHCCKLGAKGDAVVGLALPPSLEELDVSGSDNVVLLDTSLTRVTRLRVLRAAHTWFGFAAFSALPPSLAHLDVSGCVSHIARASFAHLRGLTTLHAASTDLNDAALATLPPSLLTLDVSKCDQLTTAALFPPLPALRQLDVSGTAIGDAVVASMPRQLVELRMLNCEGVTPRVSMDHLTALTLLHSSGTAVPPATLAAHRARGCVAAADGVVRGHGGEVTSLAVLASGLLVSGGRDGTVRLWSTARGGQEVEVLQKEGTRIKALAALSDGRRVAIGTGDGAFVVQNTGIATRAGRGVTDISINSEIYCMDVLKDGRVAVADVCGDVFVVDADAGGRGGALKADAWAMVVLHNGLLAVGTDHNTVDLWDVGKQSCVATLAGPDDGPCINSLAVLVDGRLAASNSNGTVCLWDVDTLLCVGELDLHAKPSKDDDDDDDDGGDDEDDDNEAVVLLAALPDGRLATGASDGTIRVWDTRPAAHGHSRPAAAPIPAVAPALEGHTTAVTALAPLPGGRLASASADGTVRLWVLPPLPALP